MTPSWGWSSDTTIDAITALNASTRAASYTTLIPEVYGATDLQSPLNGPNIDHTDDVTTYASPAATTPSPRRCRRTSSRLSPAGPTPG